MLQNLPLETYVDQTVDARHTVEAQMTLASQNPAGINATSVAQTVIAGLTQSAPAGGQTGSPVTDIPPTSIPPTAPPPPPPVPTITTVPCDWAGFVSDMTIPDGTTIQPGAGFTKTWRLTNLGYCTWTTSYAVVFSSDEAMNGPAAQNLTSTVPPGGTVDISVNLVAPVASGSHTGRWKLRNASGAIFGIGSSLVGAFTVVINVPAPVEEAFAVTGVVTRSSSLNWTLGGPVCEFTLLADVTVNGPGTVKYYWQADGSDISGSSGEIKFDAAGTDRTEFFLWTPHCVSSKTGWVAVYISEPNHQLLGKAYYKMSTCDP